MAITAALTPQTASVVRVVARHENIYLGLDVPKVKWLLLDGKDPGLHWARERPGCRAE